MSDSGRSATRGIGKGRLDAFSDGVFAIAITLLVLELAIPAVTERELLPALAEEWPSYLAYLVSFATIGSLWLGHSVLTWTIEVVDAVFMRLNLLMLLLVSVLPFTTRLVSSYIGQDEQERVAAAIYGLNLVLASVMVAVLWRYATRAGLVSEEFEAQEVRYLTRRFTPGIGAYVALIILGLFRPTAAVIGYLVVALFLMLPFRPDRSRAEERQRARRDSSGH